MTLEEVIRTAIISCGAARHADLAEPIANAVRAFLGSEEVVEQVAREMSGAPFPSARSLNKARAALSSIGGE